MGWPSLSFEDDMSRLMDLNFAVCEMKTVANWIDGSACLEPCKPAETAPAQKKSLFNKGKKKETTMRYYDEYNDEYVDALPSQSDEAQKREYLAARVRRIQDDLAHDGRKTYGLVDDESPDTPTELVKRIQDGKFVIPKEYADKALYDPIRYIKWRDPDLKEDWDGHKDFCDRLSKEATKTLDIVKIADPADGLKAIQALEQFQ